MTRQLKKVWIIGFTIGLLLFVNVIRSAIIVDKSLLPRFLLLSLLLLVSWVLFMRKKRYFPNSLVAGAFMLFYLWNLCSSLWAIAPSEAIMQSQMVFLSLSVFLIVSAFTREYGAFENIFIKTQLLALLLSFVLAFYKMSTLEFYDPYKIISVSANNNLYAGFLIVSLPFVFTGYAINRGFWKYLSVAVAILTVFFIIIIQSRAAYLALFTGSLFSAVMIGWRYKSVLTKRNLLVGIVALVFIFLSVSVFYSSLDSTRRNYFLSKIPVWQYFKSYDQESVGKLLALRNAEKASNSQIAAFDFAEAYYENASLRVIFWKKSFGMIRSHPLAGVGAGNWRLNIPAYKDPPNPGHTIKNYTYSQPHNEWICILSELGIVGFLLAMCLYFIPLIMAGRSIADPSRKPHVSAVFYTSFILGFYLFAAFDFPFRRVEHNVLLFSAMAFLLNRLDLQSAEEEERPIPGTLSLSRYLPGFAVNRVVFPLILLFTVLLASARLYGEYFTLKMFRNEGKNVDQVILSGQKAENIFYQITPNTLPLAWFEGVAWYHKGDVIRAKSCFERALQLTPYEVRVLNDYGASLYSLKNLAEAKSVLSRALEIDPFFDDARFNLGAIYYFMGNRDSARLQIDLCRNSRKKSEFLEELDKPPGYPQ